MIKCSCGCIAFFANNLVGRKHRQKQSIFAENSRTWSQMELVKLLFINVVTASVAFAAFKDVCLSSHNMLRNLHSETPDLEWDAELATTAQEWANHLASKKIFQHEGIKGLGENIFYASSAAEASCANAVLSWYSEIDQYSYNNPSFSGATGHFTQVIWKSTTMLGAGIASYKEGTQVITYIVARYKPAGNLQGAFEANVKARKTGAQTPSIFTLDPSLCKDAAGTSTCENYKSYGFCIKTNQYYKIMKSHCAKTCQFC